MSHWNPLNSTKKLAFVGSLIFISQLSVGQTQNWAQASALQARLKVEEMQSTDNELIKKLVRAWDKKCSSSAPSQTSTRPAASECLLTEADVYPGGSSKILVFRGEPVTSLPGTSALFRYLLKPESAGETLLSPEQLSRKFERLAQQATQVEPKIISFSNEKHLLWDERLNRWEEIAFYNKETSTYTTIPLWPSRGASKISLPSELMARNHIGGTDVDKHLGFLLSIRSLNGKVVPVDPFISFSTNPKVALQFASSYGKLGGRLLVMAVPPEQFPMDQECAKPLKAPGSFMRIDVCGDTSVGGENEVDGVWVIDPQLLKQVIKIQKN